MREPSYLEGAVAFAALTYLALHVVCFGFGFHDILTIIFGLAGMTYGATRIVYCATRLIKKSPASKADGA